jgi:hypothetical protein
MDMPRNNRGKRKIAGPPQPPFRRPPEIGLSTLFRGPLPPPEL